MVQNVKQKLSSLKGSHGKPILAKLNRVFEKNDGLRVVEKISKILDGEDNSELNDI